MLYTINNLPARIDWEVQGPLKRTLQNAKNLLLTERGEVPYARYLGVNQGIYEQNVKLLAGTIAEEMRITLMAEPDVTVKAVRLDSSAGYLKIEVDVEISDELI